MVSFRKPLSFTTLFISWCSRSQWSNRAEVLQEKGSFPRHQIPNALERRHERLFSTWEDANLLNSVKGKPKVHVLAGCEQFSPPPFFLSFRLFYSSLTLSKPVLLTVAVLFFWSRSPIADPHGFLFQIWILLPSCLWSSFQENNWPFWSRTSSLVKKHDLSFCSPPLSLAVETVILLRPSETARLLAVKFAEMASSHAEPQAEKTKLQKV